MTYLLLIRLKQIYRYILEIGIFRSLFVICFIIYIFWLAMKYYSLTESIFVPIIYGFLLGGIHISRKDRRFLKTHSVYHRLYILLEYMLVSLPMIIVLTRKENWIEFMIFMAYIFLIGFILYGISFKGKLFLNIPYKFKLLEWINGIRKYGFVFLLLNISSLLFMTNPNIQIAVILIISFISISFFCFCESKELLESFSDNARQFLRKKFMYHIRYMVFFTFIPFVSLGVHILDNWYILPIVVMVILSLQYFAIVLKYALYAPGEDLSNNSILHFLFFLAFIFPFFTPVALYYLLTYRNKAITLLKEYLND